MRFVQTLIIATGLTVLLAAQAPAEDVGIPAESGGFSNLSKTDGTLITIPGVKSVKPTVFSADLPGAGSKPDGSLDSREADGTPIFKPGDILPGKYMMLFQVKQYNLPRPKDGWVYFAVGSDIYRANLNSRTVLQKMAQKID